MYPASDHGAASERSEPRERSEPTKRLARERVGEFEGRSPSIEDGTPEQIHAASRTRISGLIMDVMLLQNLGQAMGGQQSTVTRQLQPYQESY